MDTKLDKIPEWSNLNQYSYTTQYDVANWKQVAQVVGAVGAIGLLAVIIIDDCFGMVGDGSAIPVLSAYVMQSYNTFETMILQFVQGITHLQAYFPNLFYTVGEISKSSCELS